MAILEPKRVKLTPDEAIKALAAGYRASTGKAPSKKVLGLIAAQSAHETGGWSSMPNYLFAGQKAGKNAENVQYLRCFEVIDGQTVYFDPPDPHCVFVAFDSAQKGAKAYIDTLKSRPNWWNGLHTGTAEGYIKGLTTYPAYFTGNKDAYLARMRENLTKYAPIVSKYSENVWAQIGTALLVLAGGYGAKRYYDERRKR
jgi:hypothetical protein